MRADVDPSHYIGKRRLFQNCCGPAGLRAIYLAWSKALEYKDDILFVNMLVNRQISAGSVSVYDTEGRAIRLEIRPNRDCNLSIRVPEWTVASDIASSHTHITKTRIEIIGVHAAERIMVDFPYSITQESYTVRHQGDYGQEDFVIDFKGDSAILVKKTGGA